MAAPLHQREQRAFSAMPIIDDQKDDLQGNSGRQTDSEVETAEETPVDSSRPVIELGDLTTGHEAEVNRVKSTIITLSGAISQMRGEHIGLASDYPKLKGELRDIKLVLAKVHLKELRTIERRSSWMKSLTRLREMFQSPLTIVKARSPQTDYRSWTSKKSQRRQFEPLGISQDRPIHIVCAVGVGFGECQNWCHNVKGASLLPFMLRRRISRNSHDRPQLR